MSPPTSSSRIRVLSAKNTSTPHVLCVKAHWRFLPEVSYVGLSAATNRLYAVEGDRGWWYAAFCPMLVRFVLITLRSDDFRTNSADDFNKMEQHGMVAVINQTLTAACFTQAPADSEIKTHIKKQNLAREWIRDSSPPMILATRCVKTKVGATKL